MLGNIVNTLAIIIGSMIGFFFKNFIPDRFQTTLVKAISLAVMLVGLQMALETENVILVIISLALGAVFGEIVDIEKRLDQLGDRLQSLFKGSKSNISQGFVTASLIYCVGSMAIIGAIEGGLLGKHDVLFAKAMLDGIISIPLTASLGIGVIFSSVSVFLYQGAIVLLAGLMKDLMTPDVVREMTAVGGLLILAIGLNFIIKERIKVGNLLPALFFPVLFYFMLALLA